MNAEPVDRRRQRLLLASMVAVVAVVTLDTTILNVAIPTIRGDLHTTFASLQWVIAGYSLTLGALLIIGGRLGDLLGARRVFASGAVLFASGSLLASMATSVPTLVIGEAVLEGIGASLLLPASLATLSRRFQGPARAMAFGLWGGVAGAAAALGPVIGGWLASDYSWRWGFRINVVVAPLAALGALTALPRDNPVSRRSRVDIRGAWLLAAGLFAAVFALTEAPDHGWLANRGPSLVVAGIRWWPQTWPLSPVPVAVVGAAALLTSFVRHAREAPRPGTDVLIDLGLFRNRGFSAGLLTNAAVVVAQAGTMFVLAVFLQTTHHLTAVDAGRWLLPVGLSVLAGAQLGGRFAARLGPTTLVRAGITVQLVGVLTAVAVTSTDVGWVPFAAAVGIFGLGAGMASSQLTNVILSTVAHGQAGSAGGVATTNNSLAAALGVAALGGILRLGPLTSAGSTRWALMGGAVLLAGGALASLALPGSRPLASPERVEARARA